MRKNISRIITGILLAIVIAGLVFIIVNNDDYTYAETADYSGWQETKALAEVKEKAWTADCNYEYSFEFPKGIVMESSFRIIPRVAVLKVSLGAPPVKTSSSRSMTMSISQNEVTLDRGEKAVIEVEMRCSDFSKVSVDYQGIEGKNVLVTEWNEHIRKSDGKCIAYLNLTGKKAVDGTGRIIAVNRDTGECYAYKDIHIVGTGHLMLKTKILIFLGAALLIFVIHFVIDEWQTAPGKIDFNAYGITFDKRNIDYNLPDDYYSPGETPFSSRDYDLADKELERRL